MMIFSLMTILLLIRQDELVDRLIFARTAAVKVDFKLPFVAGDSTQGSPLLFGGSNQPNRSHFADIYPKMSEVGMTFQRGTAWLDEILPRNITLDDYRNNVNDVQNPDHWRWDTDATQNTAWIKAAAQHRIVVMLNILKVPGWLTYNGDYNGVPRDFDVYEDIIRKVYSRFKADITYVELLNEPYYFIHINDSPYPDVESATREMYYHAARAIRSVSSTVLIGGPAEDGNHGAGTIPTLLRDTRLGPNDINFISIHRYSTHAGDDINFAELRAQLALNHRPNLPIFVTEWNATSEMDNKDGRLNTERAIAYIGKNWIGFMQRGVAGTAYFALYANNVDLGGYSSTLAFYRWDADKNTASLLPQAYAWRVASKQLELGSGPYTLYQTTASGTVAQGGINAAHRPFVLMANESERPVTATITLNGLKPLAKQRIKGYVASKENDGGTPVYDLVLPLDASGSTLMTIQLPPYSLLGLLVDDSATN